jgi:protein SCO1/2
VFVSVDPNRDTPELARVYAKQFDSSFVGLTGTDAEIEALKAGLRGRLSAFARGIQRTLPTLGRNVQIFVRCQR